MRPNVRPALAMALVAAACSGDAANPPPPGMAGRLVTSLGEVAGPWDIAEFDGHRPMRLHDGVRRAFVDIGPESLGYVIECNYSGNRARVDASGTLHKVGDEPAIQTEMGCGPEREARDAAFFSFFASEPKAAWIEGGRLRLSNGHSELVLERPARRRLAHVPRLREVVGRWAPSSVIHLRGGGHDGYGFGGVRFLSITPDTIVYPGCGGARFGFRYGGDGRASVLSAYAKTDCGFDEASTALLRVLRRGPLVERDASGGISLTAGNEVITLRSEEQVRRDAEPIFLPAPDSPAPPRPPGG